MDPQGLEGECVALSSLKRGYITKTHHSRASTTERRGRISQKGTSMNDLKVSDDETIVCDGVKVTVDRGSGCGCIPTEVDIRRVLQGMTPTYCVSCDGILKTTEVMLMCFCVTPEETPSSNWAGNTQDLEACLAIQIERDRHFLHESCARKSFPRLYS